ncbi:hypothetical protein DL93DRAFT_2048808, partial [Clavulina sp. PMI_390]
VSSDQKDWAEWLDVLQFAYNNTPHSSHGQPPAQLLLGYKLRSPLDYLAQSGFHSRGEPIHVTERLKELEDHHLAARNAIKRSADKQAYYYDQGRR